MFHFFRCAHLSCHLALFLIHGRCMCLSHFPWAGARGFCSAVTVLKVVRSACLACNSLICNNYDVLGLV